MIIKFNYKLNSDKINQFAQLKWVAEKHRMKSLVRLEKFIDSYYPNKKDYNILLKEYNGKLFFGDKKAKVAIEARSGSWVIAIIDKAE